MNETARSQRFAELFAPQQDTAVDAVTVEAVAARNGITLAEQERLIAEAQTIIGRNTAKLDLPPGYMPGKYRLRLPKRGAMKADPLDDRALWVKPGKGRPAVRSPLLAAVAREEARRLSLIGENRRKLSARNASARAATSRTAKGQITTEAVQRLTAEGKRPHAIAHHMRTTLGISITPRHVRRIQAAANKSDITAAEK